MPDQTINEDNDNANNDNNNQLRGIASRARW
jgi:hypothetical protein